MGDVSGRVLPCSSVRGKVTGDDACLPRNPAVPENTFYILQRPQCFRRSPAQHAADSAAMRTAAESAESGGVLYFLVCVLQLARLGVLTAGH